MLLLIDGGTCCFTMHTAIAHYGIRDTSSASQSYTITITRVNGCSRGVSPGLYLCGAIPLCGSDGGRFLAPTQCQNHYLAGSAIFLSTRNRPSGLCQWWEYQCQRETVESSSPKLLNLFDYSSGGSVRHSNCGMETVGTHEMFIAHQPC